MKIDFEAINRAALAVLPALLCRWYPAGRLFGAEFCVGSLDGEAGRSLKINLRSGVWCDFAAGVGGADPVSLMAARSRCTQGDAAKILAKMLGVSGGD
jgi:putative DNA primase/helicase